MDAVDSRVSRHPAGECLPELRLILCTHITTSSTLALSHLDCRQWHATKHIKNQGNDSWSHRFNLHPFPLDSSWPNPTRHYRQRVTTVKLLGLHLHALVLYLRIRPARGRGCVYVLQRFYRAMHFSANARYWDRMSSVRLSVRLSQRPARTNQPKWHPPGSNLL